MQEHHVEASKEAASAAAAAATSTSSTTPSAAGRRQRQTTCFKCNDPESRATICSREGPTRGGYCKQCFRRYIGWSLRETFFRHCRMMPFLQERDKELFHRSCGGNNGMHVNDNYSSCTHQGEDDDETIPKQSGGTSSTKIALAVSGSYSSMAMLVQMVELNNELAQKYATVSQHLKDLNHKQQQQAAGSSGSSEREAGAPSGDQQQSTTKKNKKQVLLPPSGKGMCVRPMEIYVIHLTSCALRNGGGDDDEHGDDNSGDSADSSLTEDQHAQRILQRKRVDDILSVCQRLGIPSDHIIIKPVSEALSQMQQTRVVGASPTSAQQKEKQDAAAMPSTSSSSCHISASSSSSLVSSCFMTGSSRALPLSVREDVYRCLVRRGLVQVASSEELQVSAVVLGHNATSASWNALADVTRGRGSALYESCGILYEFPSSSSYSSSSSNLKILRPMAGISARELVMFCTVCCRDTFPELSHCCVDNPTSFSPGVTSLDRTLEDFVLNMSKSFASTAFNVTRSIDKMHQINTAREEAVSSLFPEEHEDHAVEVAAEGDDDVDDARDLAVIKKTEQCALCLFCPASADVGGRGADAGFSSMLCEGCRALVGEVQSLSVNLPSASAKKASGDFLALLLNEFLAKL